MNQDEIKCTEWKKLLKKATGKWDKKVESKKANVESVYREFSTLTSSSKNAPPACVKSIVERLMSYFSENINLGMGTISSSSSTLMSDQIDAIIDIINEIEDMSIDDDNFE